MKRLRDQPAARELIIYFANPKGKHSLRRSPIRCDGGPKGSDLIAKSICRRHCRNDSLCSYNVPLSRLSRQRPFGAFSTCTTRSKYVTGIQSDLSRSIRATVAGSGEPNHRMIAASNNGPPPAMLNNVSDDRSLSASISPNTSTALTS